ncbi:hypothetical protein PR202_gb02472 [Eleusine coracana subsp. coracana]|uniref:Uncharacterized protein n=1 Tax=Eleusine coracana subsp. coracana TaxID=191504 RepID=A0AAV5DZ29_ELECO|nr:hypothetical protein QOZ80_8BG0668160 [Eleusine coracana subsp. coracana]GJN15551.1 hypothetical protein PR202_gb02472 [Eleusine coracana subsp. coracana]
MAPPSGRRLINGFYKQKKKEAGVVVKLSNKPPSTNNRCSKNVKPKKCIIAIHQTANGDGVDRDAELRRFDMDIGVTRLRRWERAAAMGLSPPPRLRDLITMVRDASSPFAVSRQEQYTTVYGDNNSTVALECLWAGKV